MNGNSSSVNSDHIPEPSDSHEAHCLKIGEDWPLPFPSSCCIQSVSRLFKDGGSFQKSSEFSKVFDFYLRYSKEFSTTPFVSDLLRRVPLGKTAAILVKIVAAVVSSLVMQRKVTTNCPPRR